jgi:dihydroxyacetone kinase-like predicted kinase
VVDAAARGFELCVRAFAAAVAGENGKAPTDGARAGRPAPSQGHPAAEAPGHAAGEPGPAFEVQYLLACGEDDVRELERYLATIGDSITVARGDGRCRVHVHTDDAGAAIEAATRRGPVSRIEVAYLGDGARSDRSGDGARSD